MKWEIDRDIPALVLDGHYPIYFDSLTDGDYFRHLSEKSWIDMREILPAFVAAYDSAGIPLSKHFFKRYKAAFFRRAEEDYENRIQELCNDRVYGGKLLWIRAYASSDSDSCIDEILKNQYNFSKAEILSAIYDVGDAAYSKYAVCRAITSVTNELQSPMSPEISIFEYRMHHWLRVQNCGRKTTDLIMKALESLIDTRMKLGNGNV
tara:strand:+ start:396 stop:1016 length:621 start_codon:yes stop_codon:yes gene_type:complete